MNYTRRTTRPDGMHYRETRKHVGSSRHGRRRGGRGGLLRLLAFLVGVAAVAGVVVWVFHR